MKGTPDAPKCGFSSKVVNALKEEGLKFGSFSILTDGGEARTEDFLKLANFSIAVLHRRTSRRL